MNAKVLRLERQKKLVWERVSHNLVRHLPSGVYYVRKFKAGKGALFKTTGEKRKLRAQTIADEMVGAWIGNRLSGKRNVRVGQFVTEVREQLRQEFELGDRSEKTWEQNQTFLTVIDGYFGHLLLDELDEEFWASWVRSGVWQKDRSTLFDVAKHLSVVLERAHRAKLISRKPKIRNPDRPRGPALHKIVSPAEMQAIAGTLVRAENDWLLLQLHLGAECGNRTIEVRTLRWEMVEFHGDAVTIRWAIDKAGRARGKGREFEASPRTAELLWAYRRKVDRDASPYVFPMPTDPKRPQTKVYQNRAWRKALAEAGITRPIWFYWLRHTFYTTALLEARLPVQHVSEYGGTSIRTLQKNYLHSDAKRTREVAGAVRIGHGSSEQVVKRGKKGL